MNEAIKQFCEEEVARQLDDPRFAVNLMEAWQYAMDSLPAELSIPWIRELGRLAKPGINAQGFRTYPIRIGWDIRDNHGVIHTQLASLCEAYNEGRLDPQELYEEYEYIHPFGDGNGRTGKILFNWANGTLLDPVMPANPHGWAIP